MQLRGQLHSASTRPGCSWCPPAGRFAWSPGVGAPPADLAPGIVRPGGGDPLLSLCEPALQGPVPRVGGLRQPEIGFRAGRGRATSAGALVFAHRGPDADTCPFLELTDADPVQLARRKIM